MSVRKFYGFYLECPFKTNPLHCLEINNFSLRFIIQYVVNIRPVQLQIYTI